MPESSIFLSFHHYMSNDASQLSEVKAALSRDLFVFIKKNMQASLHFLLSVSRNPHSANVTIDFWL